MIKNLFLLATLTFAYVTAFSTSHTVNSGSFYFSPANLNITVGDTVIWINDGGNHNVNGTVNSINNENFDNPESFYVAPTNETDAIIFTHVFTIPGTYNYDCSVGSHAVSGMVGTINVAPLPTVFEIVESSEAHDTLEIAITTAELETTLSGEGPFTLFAPTDAAFGMFEPGVLDVVLANTEVLKQILLHHAVSGTTLAADLEDGQTIITLNEDIINVSITGSTVMIDDATVIIADILASNGVVHVIDVVLTPPTDELTVMDIIAASQDHTTLETALIQTGLDVILSGDGPFTVFAPTDEAFDNLPDGALEELLEDNTLLEEVLLYHVHSGELLAADLTNEMAISTVNGADLTSFVDENGEMINTSNVTVADTETSNGILHIIDQVLIVDDTSIDSFYELNKEEYLHTINLLGKVVNRNAQDKVLIDVYSNGKVIKRYRSNK
jgi:uncharacterized surface protein with fasciclin (FAS1) repeats